MFEPKVTEEVSYSTIETSSKSTTTNKKILRNTWTGNTVQINSYDSDGRLKGVETDKQTYQDHDTEYYKWTDHDQPPDIPLPEYQTQVEPLGANSVQTLTQIASNGNVLMLKSTEVASTPIIHWTGDEASQQSSVKSPSNGQFKICDQNGDVEPQKAVNFDSHVASPQLYPGNSPKSDAVVSHTIKEGPVSRETDSTLTESLEGSKWSRNEETVWVSTNNPRINPNLAIMNGPQEGGKSEGHPAQQNGSVSMEERRKMRRNAARAMTANMAK
jgi:hypothetical protein